MRSCAALALILSGGCLHPNTLECSGGGETWVCPLESACTQPPTYCGTPAEVGACQGKVDNDPCSSPLVADGLCVAGVCETCSNEIAGCRTVGWNPMDSQTTAGLAAVAFVGDGEAYAAGDNGTMLHYQKSGWTVDTTFPSADLVGQPITSIVATAGKVYAAAGPKVYVLDGGAWTKLGDPMGLGFKAMWASGSDVFLVGPAGNIAHYVNGGWTGTTFGTASYNAVWGTSPSDVYASGTTSSIIHFDGTAWSQVSGPTTGAPNLVAIWGASGEVFATGRAGTASSVIVHSIAGGPFTPMTTPTIVAYALWGSSATNVFAAGDVGTILHWDGVAWTKMLTSITTAIAGVSGSSAAEVFAVSTAGTILRFTGAGWADPTGSKVTSKLLDVWAAAPNDAVAVGAGVFRLQGSAWVDNNISIAGGSTAVWGRGPNDIEVVGQLAAAHWNGTAWSQTMTNGIGALSAPVDLWGSSTSLYAAGTGVVEYNGTSWAQIAGQASVAADWVSASGKVWVAGATGVGHVDGGSVATDVTGAPFKAIWGVDDQHIFAAGTAEIRAFDGSSWQAMQLPASVGVQLDGLWGRSATDVFAVGAASTVLHYRAGLWRTIGSLPSPGDLVSVSGMGASIFVASSDGNVYQLIDTAP